MANKTPIRIRGKRNATQAEKWNPGKRRKTATDGSPASSGRSSTTGSIFMQKKSSRNAKRRPQGLTLSRLEDLPPEILQEIFVFAGNVDLALASPTLAAKLTSAHVHHQLTSRVLEPVLEGQQETRIKADKPDLATATRLLNSRFMTWDFFKSWLEQQPYQARPNLGDLDDLQNEPFYHRDVWTNHLRPSDKLLPPKKLLRGPWTEDKVAFLRTLSAHTQGTIPSDSAILEVAEHGLLQAIEERYRPALALLVDLGVGIRTEHLRHAVIAAGCDTELVKDLIAKAMSQGYEPNIDSLRRSSPCRVDFLDPALWSWADKARSYEDERGQWLVDQLRVAATVVDGKGRNER